MGFTDKAGLGEPVKRQVFREVVVNIGNNLVYFFVFCDILTNSVRGGKVRAVKVNQEFHQINIGQRAAAEFLFIPAAQHFITDTPQMGERAAFRPDALVFFFARIGEAAGEIRAERVCAREEIRVDPDDKAFIRFAGTDIRLVDITVIGQQDVARAQLIGATLDDIVYITGQEKEHLIELMLMEINHGRDRIAVVIALKIRAFHGLTQGEGVFVSIQQIHLHSVVYVYII